MLKITSSHWRKIHLRQPRRAVVVVGGAHELRRAYLKTKKYVTRRRRYPSRTFFFLVKPFIPFYYLCMVEKILFLRQIFQMEILTDLQVLMSSEPESNIFSYWSVCICISVCVYHQIY